MTTTDTDALTEKIRDEVAGIVIGSGYYSTAIGVDEATEIAAAVLPIVAEEVRKAKAEALREAADSVHDNANSPYCLPCHRCDADLLHTIATEYETGDSDEHR